MQNPLIDALLAKGVQIPEPKQVMISSDIEIDRIEPRVVLYPGTRIQGSSTYISSGCRIGFQGPATIESSQLAPCVEIASGFISGAVLLEGVRCGNNAHVRAATILEEEVSFAHCVGLKQTLLFPFVTLGSLINFCDCFMAGGTSRKNHSEVGSSYIHFNYTAHQDKATPSLIGDVSKGITLQCPPIFLGGQGGLVGPRRIAYGTILAAGSICRKDITTPGLLVNMPSNQREIRTSFTPGEYDNLSRVIENNILYIANLLALRIWYGEVRSRLISPEHFPKAVYKGLIVALEKMIEERLLQITALWEKVHQSESSTTQNKRFVEIWPQMREFLLASPEVAFQTKKEAFLQLLDPNLARIDVMSYPALIQSLPSKTIAHGEEWLQNIVDHILLKYKTM